jgi:hypothetical protein
MPYPPPAVSARYDPAYVNVPLNTTPRSSCPPTQPSLSRSRYATATPCSPGQPR